MKSVFDLLAVPLGSALITATFSGILVYSATELAGWPDSRPVALFAFSFIALFSWLAFRQRAVRAGELFHGVDTQALAAPAQVQQSTIRVEIGSVNAGSRWMDYLDLDNMDQDRLLAFAVGLHRGHSLALTLWAGRGKLFSRPQFESIRQALIDQGLARWKVEGAPQQGAELTARGRAVVRGIAASAQPPTGDRDVPELRKGD